MPTALGRIRRRLDPGGSQSIAGQRAASQPQGAPVGPPFGGFVPDLPPALCGLGDGQRACSGLVQLRGTMATPPGFVRFGAATLPLGDATPPAPAPGQPVVALFLHRDTAVSPTTLRRYGVTADPVLGHFYELAGGAWTDIPYTGAGAGLTGGATPARALCDAAYGALSNRIYLSNGIDPVYHYVPGAANYTDWSPAVLNPFKAKSVCAAFQRILAINTNEGGTPFTKRIRYSTTGAAPSLSGTGAGFIDLDQVSGEGVCIRPLGNRVVAHCRQGMALLRATGSLTPSPIAIDYVTNERGLLGTFATCEVSRGIHFGIFNDGWFFLQEDGTMSEAGVQYVGNQAYSKWKTFFYDALNPEQADRIQCAYDPRKRQVHVIWPSASQTNVDERWIYDIGTDTVWPAPVTIGCQPNCLGRLVIEDDSETWNSITTTWDTENRLWDELTAVEGASAIVLGTRNGLVLGEEPTVASVDGVLPSYEFLSPRSDFGMPSVVKHFERLDFHYEIRVGASAPNINLIFDTDAGVAEAPGQEVRSISQLAGTIGSRIVGYATSNISGHTLGWGVSGQAPVLMHLAVPYVVPLSRTGQKNMT